MADTFDVTSPVAGFTGEVAGTQFEGGRGRTSVPGAVQYFRRHGYQVVPADADPSGTGEGDVGGSGAGECPARSARKSEWLAYAATVDPEADLDGWTKDELIDRYGGDG